MKILTALVCLAMTQMAMGASNENPRVELKTSLGVIVLELDPAGAPKTVENFLQYVKDGFYDGLIFHRVINGFMIQGGGFSTKMQQKEGRAPIANEAKTGLKNKVGTIAMARTSAPHSASSQFFINLKDNGFLDYPGQDGWGYTAFGKVVSGMDVVEKIGKVETTRVGPYDDVPGQPVIIESIKLLPNKS